MNTTLALYIPKKLEMSFLKFLALEAYSSQLYPGLLASEATYEVPKLDLDTS